MKNYDEGMLDSLQNLLLIFNVIDMLTFDNLCLLHGLNSILMGLIGLDPANPHISKGTYIKMLRS